MLNLVNGFVCANCNDAELAKRGVDPSHHPREARLLGGTTTVNPPAKEAAEEEEAQRTEPRKSIEPGVGVKLDIVG